MCLTNSCLKEPHCFKDTHTHKNSQSSADIFNQCTILENSPDTLRRGRTLENRKFMNNDHLFPLFSSNSKLKYDMLRIIKPRWKYCKRNSQLNYPAHTEACSACAPKEWKEETWLNVAVLKITQEKLFRDHFLEREDY